MATANILVVHENAGMGIIRFLQRLNHSVVDITDSSQEAIRLSLRSKLDIVLFDVNDREELHRSGLANKIRCSLKLPVIVCSKTKVEATLEEDMPTLPVVNLEKPYKLSELKMAIDFALHNGKVSKEVENLERSLSEYLEINRKTQENLRDPVFITDDQGNFTYVSSNIKHVLGYKTSDVLKKENIHNLLTYPNIDMSGLQLHLPLENVKCVIRDSKGRKKDFLMNVKQVSIRKGTRLFTFHDVTDLKKIKKLACPNKHCFFDQIFEHAPMGMALVDSESGQFTRVNQSYARTTGYSREELLAQTLHEISSPEDFAAERVNVAKLENNKIDHFTMVKQLISKDGSLKWIRQISLPVGKRHQRRSRYMILAEDISDKKQLATLRNTSHDNVRRIYNTLNEFLASNSHSESSVGQGYSIDSIQDNLPQFINLQDVKTNLKVLLDFLAVNKTQQTNSLTPIEKRVARLVKSTVKTKQIAEMLSISKQTVETHRKNIRKKLGLTNCRQNLSSYLSEFY